MCVLQENNQYLKVYSFGSAPFIQESIAKHSEIHIESILNIHLKYQNETVLITFNQEYSGMIIAKHGAIHIMIAVLGLALSGNNNIRFNSFRLSSFRLCKIRHISIKFCTIRLRNIASSRLLVLLTMNVWK